MQRDHRLNCVLAKQKTTVDEFLTWAEGREGRYEDQQDNGF
jgi:hypothetical protein